MTKKSDAKALAAEIKKNGNYAVFFDIDQTLIPRLASKGVTPRMAKAISEARKRGHKFFLNSGRSYGYIDQCIIDSAEFDGVVSGLGGYITYHGKVVYSDLVPKDIQLALIDYCDAHGESIIFEGVADELDGRFSFNDSGFFNVAESRTESDKQKFLKLIENREIIKITVPYLPCREYADFLEKYFEMAYIADPAYAEGALIGNNKGEGIYRVCDALGIPYTNTLAAGDSGNDMRMLDHAAIPVAMGNAEQQVKDICRFVCGNVTEDGAAIMVEQLFLTDTTEA